MGATASTCWMSVLATIDDPAVIHRSLIHLGLSMETGNFHSGIFVSPGDSIRISATGSRALGGTIATSLARPAMSTSAHDTSKLKLRILVIYRRSLYRRLPCPSACASPGDEPFFPGDDRTEPSKPPGANRGWHDRRYLSRPTRSGLLAEGR